jgi:hypothetical protein
MATNGYHARSTNTFTLDLKWTSQKESCEENLGYVFEKYGGLEKTRTSDLFRVKEAL